MPKFGENQNLNTNLSQSHDHGTDFRWFFRMVKAHRLWVLSSLMVAASITLLFHIFETQIYSSAALLSATPKEKISPISELSGASSVEDFIPRVHSLIEQFKSKEVCQSIQIEVQKKVLVKNPCDLISIEPDYQKMQLRVVARTENPRLSGLLANIAATKLIEFDKKHLIKKLGDLKAFLKVQQEDLGEKLKKLETEKAQFQSESSIISVNQAEKVIFENLEKNEQQYLDLQVRLKSNEALIVQSRDSLVKLKKALTENGGNFNGIYLSQIQYRLNMLQYRKSMYKAEGNTAEVDAVEKEIQSTLKVYRENLDKKDDSVVSQGSSNPLQYLQTLQASLRSLVKDRSELKLQMKTLEEALQKKGTEIKGLANAIQKLGEINRQIENTSSLYVIISKRLQEVQIEEAATVSEFSILRNASVGVLENAPLSRKIIFSMGIGVFLCLSLLFLKDFLIPSIRNPKELQNLGIQSIGSIPTVTLNPLHKNVLLLKEFPHSFAADAFRALRLRLVNQVRALNEGAQGSVLLVGSPVGSCGKTFVSVNLAHAIAKAGYRVLLLDLDLRHPSVSAYFPDVNFPRGVDEMRPGDNVEDFITTVEPNLDVIIGKSNVDDAADLIESLKPQTLLTPLKAKYDFILIDTPPVLSTIDSVLLASAMDAIVMVAAHLKTHRDDISAAVMSLLDVKSLPIFGVTNMVHPEISSTYSDKYYVVTTARPPKKKTG